MSRTLAGHARLLDRLHTRVNPDEGLRVERVLAGARVFLAVASLVAVWLDPTEPPRYAALSYVLLGLYALHSLIILSWLRFRRAATPAFCLALHAVDILWPVCISVFTAGPSSPFFFFNAFVLLAAAYRWGLAETLATAGVAILLFVAEAVFADHTAPSVRLFLGGFELNRILMRGVYLLMMGYLLGYLAEREKRGRSEAAALAVIGGRIQSQLGLRAALKTALHELLMLFRARRGLLALRDLGAGRAMLWDARIAGAGTDATLESVEPDSELHAACFFEPPGEVWYSQCRTPLLQSSNIETLILDQAGDHVRNPEWAPPAAFLKAVPFRSLLAASIAFGSEWSGQLSLLEPSPGTSREVAARFLQMLCRQLTPVLNGVLLTDRLHVRAGAAERARVARELHDGVIQSLIGLEMEMEVLRQRAQDVPNLAGELSRLQQVLHREVLSLRELIQHMKALELDPKELLEFLATTVDKFGRDTGVEARFVSALEEVRLSPHMCGELARIVQEGLANVRRHSGARHVVVRFEDQEGFWKLVIDDDGRGFDFSGRLEQAELDAARKGPLVIKERVRALGGALTVESLPGRGARLEILVPQKSRGHER